MMMKRSFTQMLGDVEEPTAPFGMLDTYGDARDVEEFTQSVDDRLALRLRTQAKALGVSPARYLPRSLCLGRS